MIVPVGISLDGAMMELKSDGAFVMLPRLQKYYKDTEYKTSEIPLLINEINYLRRELQSNYQLQQRILEINRGIGERVMERVNEITKEGLIAFLNRLESLCQIALSEQKAISVQCD